MSPELYSRRFALSNLEPLQDKLKVPVTKHVNDARYEIFATEGKECKQDSLSRRFL